MHRFVLLLFILGLAQSIYAASIFQFPDLTRRIPERPTSPGCVYKGVRYEHGDSVPTAEPCLNCTCARAVLVCYLRVCPTSSAPPPGCFAAREIGECCPKLHCRGTELPRPSNTSDPNRDLRPTFRPSQEKTTDDSFTGNDYLTETTSSEYGSSADSTEFNEDGTSAIDEYGTTTVDKVVTTTVGKDGTTTVDKDGTTTVDKDGTTTVDKDGKTTIDKHGTTTVVKDGTTTDDKDGAVTIQEKATTNIEISKDDTTIAEDHDFYETTQNSEISPTDTYLVANGTTFHPSEDDSLVYITSTREPTSDYDMNFFNDIPAGGCMVNGTLYGDGSAMLSSTFCEYCFCIRGKSTCLKPKCHLTIEGCIPHYDNHYTCCPSRYDCTQKTSSVETGDTTTLSSTVIDTTQYLGDTVDCYIDGTVYRQGALIPNHKSCHNCYCNDSTVICEKIKCSPPIEGCSPIIPQGYCCPISYRCDYERGHLASNSIKGSNLNGSTISVDNKGTDFKSMKNYYAYNNENVRVKTPTERESISLLHNVVPILRRLDENSDSEQNSTLKSVDNESRIQIGYGVPTDYDEYVEKNADSIRENDKTLKLEHNDTALDLYPLEERTSEGGSKPFNRGVNSRDEVSRVETITLGSPVEYTLTIQELFDQFFGRQKPNTFKVPPVTSLEPKRNNSKQPSSIVEIYELEGDNPTSTTKQPSTINVQTTEKDNKIISENAALNTKTEDLKAHSLPSNYDVLPNNNNSFSDNTNRRTTEILDITSNQEKKENEVPSLFPTTENGSAGDFHTFSSTESKYPTFISSSNKESEEGQSETETYAGVKAFTTRENFDNEDILERSSSSHVFTTIDNLFNLKSDSTPHTNPVFTITNSENKYSEESKNTQSTSPDYSTTKAALIEELKSQTQTRPVVFIYDITKNVHNEQPTTHQVTQSIPSLHDTTRSSFPTNPIGYSDAQPTSLLDETTKILIAEDSADQADTSVISSTVEDIYNVLKNHESILSVSPVHIATTNQNNVGMTETHQPNIHIFDTTSDINYDDEIKSSPSPILFMTTVEHTNNYDQTETLSSIQTSSKEHVKNHGQAEIHSLPSQPSTINQYGIRKKQTLVPFTHTTKTNFENGDLLDIQTTRPTFYTETTKNINNEDFQSKTTAQNTSVSLANKKYQEDANKVGQTLNSHPNTKIILTTTVSEDGRLSKTESYSTTEANFPNTKTQDKDYSIDMLSQAEINSQKAAPIPTETSKVSTRINSKLPSFNYVEKIDQQRSNTSHSNYPMLTDSYLNTYFPGEGSDSDSEKEDFTNIGSIYLGAPLAVGGTDSRKDNDDGKPKITHSGGVIFLDPKFTDIDTKTDIKPKGTSQNGSISANTEEQTFIEKAGKDSSNSERKKGMRNQAQSKAGQGFQIIPFVAEDAVKGQFGKLNDTFAVQPGVTEGLPDIVSDFCFIKGRIYMNGEVIGKLDPCELCRCFYGRELCQIQRCPTPPPGCVPDKVPGFCCPRFTCGNNATFNEEMKLVGIVLPSEVSSSTTRKPDIIDRKPPTNDKQEMKFGIRVRVRPSPTPFVRTSEYTTETKTMLEKTTLKPEIRTIFNRPSTTKATTTTSKPVITSNIPETKITTTTTRTTTTTTSPPSPLFPDPWGLLKVSGCNIYGKFFNINDQVEILSGPCSHCICTTNGVECNDIC